MLRIVLVAMVVVLGTVGVPVGLAVVRCFDRDVAVTVDAQNHAAARGAERTTGKHREAQDEAGDSAKGHQKTGGNATPVILRSSNDPRQLCRITGR